MAWTNSASLNLKTDWQFSEPVEGEFFRFKHSEAPSNGLVAIAQAQFNEDGSIDFYDSRGYEVDNFSEIIQLKKPSFFPQRRIAIRRLPLPISLELQLRSLLRPALFSSPFNSGSIQASRKSWVVRIDVSDTISPSISLQSLETKINALAQQVAAIVPRLDNLDSEIDAVAENVEDIEEKISTSPSSTSSSNVSQPQQTNSSSNTPKIIFGADLIGWYRADNTISTNGKVSQWTDLSGNNNHAQQPNSGNQPTLISVGFNGKPVIRFDNQDVWFSLPDMLNPGWGQASLFVVYNLKDNSQHWDLMRTGSNPGCYWGTNNVFGYAGYFGEFRAHRLEGQPSNMSVVGQHLLEVVSGIGNNSYKVFRDTNNLLTTSPSWGVSNTPYIGRGADTRRMNGDIAEVFLVKRAATDSERIAVQQYIKDFWQLTSW